MSEPSDRTAPLGIEAALARAAQIAALADPDRLRVLSALAVDPDATNSPDFIAATLDLEPAEVARHLEVLVGAGLAIVRPGELHPHHAPSAEAWVRFGRLLAGKPAYVEHGPPPASAMATLPPQIQRISDRLAYRFGSTFSRETVERYVAESYELLRARAKATRHLPSLTSRFASDRLGALAAAQGFDLTGTPEVLFVCVQNSGRSQIAAGLLRQRAGGDVHVRTAGSLPAAAIDDVVVQVLEEVGVPVVAEFPKPLTDEVVQAADIVITMGCGDACPVYPGRRYMDWKIADPIGLPIDEVRAVREQIRRHVDDLVEGLGLAPSDQSTLIR